MSLLAAVAIEFSQQLLGAEDVWVQFLVSFDIMTGIRVSGCRIWWPLMVDECKRWLSRWDGWKGTWCTVPSDQTYVEVRNSVFGSVIFPFLEGRMRRTCRRHAMLLAHEWWNDQMEPDWVLVDDLGWEFIEGE